MKKTIIGLTGKIGAGKTSISSELGQLPYVQVFNCDLAVAELYKDKHIQHNLREYFGTHIRSEIASKLNTAPQLVDLADIFKARMQNKIHNWVDSYSSGVLIIDSPLLFEHGSDSSCDITIQISAEYHIRQARIANRSSRTANLFELIDVSQMNQTNRSALADFTIDNNDKLQDACKQLEMIIRPAIPTVAMYAGSFDPIHLGHLDIIKQSTDIFDHVIVAIGTNEHKESMFTKDQRVQMVEEETKHLQNVSVIEYSGLLVAAAKQQGAAVIVRGIRDANDATNEYSMGGINRQLDPLITTVMIPGNPKYQFVSSSTIKGLCHFRNTTPVDLSHLISDNINDYLNKRLS